MRCSLALSGSCRESQCCPNWKLIHSCLTVLFIILVAGGCEELNHPETQEHPDSAGVLIPGYYGTLRERRAAFWHETDHTIWEFRGWILLGRTGIWAERSRQ